MPITSWPSRASSRLSQPRPHPTSRILRLWPKMYSSTRLSNHGVTKVLYLSLIRTLAGHPAKFTISQMILHVQRIHGWFVNVQAFRDDTCTRTSHFTEPFQQLSCLFEAAEESKVVAYH